MLLLKSIMKRIIVAHLLLIATILLSKITNDSLSVSYEVISSASSSVSMSDQLQRPAGNIQDQLGANTDQYARITIWGNVSVCLLY